MAHDADDGGELELTLNIDIDDERPAISGRRSTYLVILSGNRIGEVVTVTDGLTIGRGSTSGVRIADMGASRLHARLEINAQRGVTLIDLKSRNGTYLNGKRIQCSVLHDGDKIRVGTSTILKFSHTDKLEEKFQQQLYDSTIRDPLTGLYNRRHLENQLDSEFSYSNRNGAPFSLLMLDLDHFKRVNDRYGHQTGDEVLAAFALVLKSYLRREDIAARYGGEEFAVICRDLTGDKVFQTAEQLRTMIEKSQLVSNPSDLRVTVSIGISTAPKPTITASQQLIAAADDALYEAKRSGRNCVVLNERMKKSNVE